MRLGEVDIRDGACRLLHRALTCVLGVVYVCLDTSIYRSLIVLVAFGIAHVLAGSRPVSGRVVALVLAVLIVAGLSEKPDGTDLWIYQSYGRMVATHHANPYVSVPDDFPDDAVIQRVLPMYRSDPSVYGPVLVTGSTVIAAVSGESELAGRLLWQMACAIAVVATALLLRRRDVSNAAVLLFAASPLVVYQFLNQAHNDVFVGLLVLAGCLAADRRRTIVAALCFAAAALVKAPVGVALVVYLVWLAARGERRESVKAALVGAVFAVAALAPFGFVAALTPMLDQRGSVNATSIWNLVRGDVATFLWRPIRSTEAPAGRALSAVAMLVPVVISVIAAFRRRERPLHEAMSIALLAWFVFALHPSVWYLGWVIPLFMMWPRAEALRVTAYSTLCLVVSQAWLMPVAARLTGDGSLSVIDRLAAVGLGASTVLGLWLMVRLLRHEAVTSRERG